MSHFSVLVVGDVDYNMAPFHEFECTGRDDEFIQDLDETESRKASYEEAKKSYQEEVAKGASEEDTKYSFKGTTFREYLEDYCEVPIVAHESLVDRKKTHKWGYAIDLGDDNFKVIRRTNPNKFYDYYGSGYRGFLLKEKSSDGSEQWVNKARKGDIDFQGMFESREKKAREAYQKVITALGYTPKLEHTWASLVDQFTTRNGHEPTMTRDEADAIYKEQQAVKDWQAALKDGRINWMDLGCWVSVDDFAMTEDEYVASQHIHALTFGYVQNRVYHSNGDMGWWAIVSDEKDPNAWDKEYRDFIEALPDDAELSILDCHI